MQRFFFLQKLLLLPVLFFTGFLFLWLIPQPVAAQWNSGAYGNTMAEAKAWGDWRGRPVDAWTIFVSRPYGWGPIENPTNIYNQMAGFKGDLNIAVPFWPEKSGGSLSACANGDYDSHWKTFGTSLKNSPWPNAIVRLAWEFNGGWFEWKADNVDLWKKCFQNTSNAIKSTNPQARIDWTMNRGTTSGICANNVWNCYPGDAYVDIIGVDYYDFYDLARNETEWNNVCNKPDGLCSAIKFAREHKKKFSVGEWGIVTCRAGASGGDNPFYIQKMYDTFAANKDILEYENYFEDMIAGNVCSDLRKVTPNAAAKYKQLFGTSLAPGQIVEVTPNLQSTTLRLTLALHGIGKGGDNTNPAAQGSFNPKRATREAVVEIYNNQNTLITSKTIDVTFSSLSGKFAGEKAFDDIPNGDYVVKVKVKGFLRKQVPGIQVMRKGSTTNMPETVLITGDINDDNKLNVQDYNLLFNCYEDLEVAKNCLKADGVLSDITDDGKVDSFDYNLFLRELATVSG